MQDDKIDVGEADEIEMEIDLESSTKIDNVGFIFSNVVLFTFGFIHNSSNKNKESIFSVKSRILILALLSALYKYWK